MRVTDPGRRWRTAAGFVAGVVAICALALAPGAASAAKCPTFRVLHDDRIGAAGFPAGTYGVKVDAPTGLSCAAASKLFARFLEDWDGKLPAPWRVETQGRGAASFRKGAQPGFSVSLAEAGGGGGRSELGSLCPGTFSVLARTRVANLIFDKGRFLLYIPAGSGIPCPRASALFTRFLGAGGTLPAPWRVRSQTATFYKPANPRRSAFRVETLNGAG
jgi:hypothetical protein